MLHFLWFTVYVNVMSAVQLCISTKMPTPEKVGGDKTQGVPSTSKSRGDTYNYILLTTMQSRGEEMCWWKHSRVTT